MPGPRSSVTAEVSTCATVVFSINVDVTHAQKQERFIPVWKKQRQERKRERVNKGREEKGRKPKLFGPYFPFLWAFCGGLKKEK